MLINDQALLARAAAYAYLDPVPCAAAAAKLGLVEVECLFDTEAELYLGRHGDRQLVVFRGTEPRQIHDWFTDIKVRRRSWGAEGDGPGSVHRGFADAADEVFEDVVDRLDPDLPVLFAGHSLGAAEATYTAARLLHEFPGQFEIEGLVIGSPRVWDVEAAEWFSRQLWDRWFRVVRNNDVVTRLFFRAAGYKHTGRLIWLDRRDRIIHDPAPWIRFKDRLAGRVESLLGEPDIREVPGVEGEVWEKLNSLAMTSVRRYVDTSAIWLLTSQGIPQVLATRIVEWARDRTDGGTMFDGLADHAAELYARAFERIALPAVVESS